MSLLLRPFATEDRSACLAAHEELAAEGFEFLWNFHDSMTWEHYLSMIEDYATGVNIPPDHVRAALLVAEVEGEVVGRISLRYALNDFLLERGGHIGYAVRPAFRRRGYAGEILRQGLALAYAHGIDPVLVTCDENNVASTAVIERAGGVLESVFVAQDGTRIRRHWIHSSPQ